MTPRTSSPGRFIQQPGGYRAFVPQPLPPSLELTPALLRSLSDADRLIGRLAGEGANLPNPHLLSRPFVKREAALSSRIEGTQATLGELLAVDAGAAVERSPDDLREVGNYVTAAEYGHQRLATLPLSTRLVRELHAKLMEGVRGGQADPGQLRRIQNWIGPSGSTILNATYIPPPPDLLAGCLDAWERFLHDRSLPPLIQIGLAHYQFEAIHPFLDGNGRVGRLLITLFLIERNILPTPLLNLSAFFEATRGEYYDRLAAVTRRSAWVEWLEYFLNGIARMAEDVADRTARISDLLVGWHRSLAGSASRTPDDLVTLLAENPFWTTRKAAERLDVAYTSAQRAIDKLQAADILQQVGQARRNRVYCAKQVLAILEAPPKLVP